ncbi:MAG: metalloregulator ArsR/SmtB family transcription factor [Solirubrobacteraceae bacterium]|nr:metalloregulator ArsR/SmtB family transcription factor [Solirubrobacteraceae bacterium]
MAQLQSRVDDVFAALADPTRRAVVRQLGLGPAAVGELAASTPITLPSFMKHIHALEACGLVRTEKVGRVRRCELDRSRLRVIDDWLAEQRDLWEQQTDRLERFLVDDDSEGPSA